MDSGAGPEETSIAMGALFARVVASAKLADSGGAERDGIVDAMLEAMAGNIGKKGLEVEKLTEGLGCSYSYARRLFSRKTGFPPERYYANLVAAEAKERLLDSAMSVKEVADSLGFDDPYYFSRFFKNRVGQSPRQFRESYRGWI